MLTNYFVYIITNPAKTVLYTGFTNNIVRRMREHFNNRGKPKTFAGRYFCYNLVYYEIHYSPMKGIEREKEIKNMSREDKEALINEFNPNWNFLKF